MTLKLMTIIMGVIWWTFGYRIYKKRKLSLINRYVDGKITETGALMIGRAEMIYGIVAIPTGIAMFFMPVRLVQICFTLLHSGIIAAVVVLQKKYRIHS